MISDETRQKLSIAGKKGGRAKVQKGFATNKERAISAGRKGAAITNAKRTNKLK